MNVFAASTDNQVLAIYQHFTEKDWREMAAEEVRAWVSEIHRRGLGTLLEAELKLRTLPHERAMTRVLATEAGARVGKAIAKAIFPTETSPSIEREDAAVAEPVRTNDLPSSEESFGALTPAASGYGIAVYVRLPLSAKRDAFVADGFLYVREGVLADWVNHFKVGECCPARRNGNGHNSDCWLGKLI